MKCRRRTDDLSVSEHTARTYRQTAVETASPAERRLMLLEGAVTWSRALGEALDAEDFDGIAESSSRCRAILVALGTDLDTRVHPDLAQRLASLHFWLYQCVVDAKSSIDLGDVVELLEFQRDAWRDAVEVLRAGDATSPPKTIDLAG